MRQALDFNAPTLQAAGRLQHISQARRAVLGDGALVGAARVNP